MTRQDSFGAEGTLEVGDRRYRIHRLSALEGIADLGRIPYSIKLLVENMLRHEDGVSVRAEDIEAVARHELGAPAREIAYSPARTCYRTSPGCLASSISPPCATPSRRSVATQVGSTHSSLSTS